MAEALQYYELWTKLPADGGTRVGFLGWPLNPRRVRRLNGDDSLTFQTPKTGLYVTSIVKGACVREILSVDGTTNVLEWLVDRYTPASGDNPLISVNCLAPITRLLNYPISQTDADGVVYRDVSAIQLPASTVMSSYILSNTPGWVTAGTTSPSGNQELPFSDDNALSGMRRWEEYAHMEAEFLRVGLTGYTLGITTRGASATKLWLQTGKNIRSWVPEYGNGVHRNRIDTIVGAPGDFGSAGIGLAYWEVVSISGAGPYTLVLKSIHGGAGPIKYDNQFNHSGLPGGANSLYLEKRDRTYTQITGSSASAQSLTIASNTTITAGDYVRIVASSTGKQLTFLDAPTEIAANGLVTGKFESGWDDTMAVNPNAEMLTWTTPTAPPDGWSTAITTTKITSANNWLTGGQSWQVNGSVSAGTSVAATPAKAWTIQARQSTFFVTAWIRVTQNTGASTGHGFAMGLMADGVLVGQRVKYIGPLNVWRQLKIEGLDLSAFVGVSKSLQVTLIGDGPTSTNLTVIIDSVNVGPATAVRATTWGSNAARIWQDANLDLDDTKAVPVSRRGSILDLASMNNVSAEDVVLGGTVGVRADELTEAADVTARIVELSEVPGSPELTEVVVSTLPVTLSRKQSKPLELTIPFFEAVEVRAATTDQRRAAILLKAAITATSATQVTITLTATDSLGAGVFISYATFQATYVSGSGLGPYVFNRPAAGTGTGRAVFTGQVAGRDDVTDAVDVPEIVPDPPITMKAIVQSRSANSITFRVTAATKVPTTVTVNYDNGGHTVTPATGGTLTSMALIGSTPAAGEYIDYTVTRLNPATGASRVTFTTTATGYTGGSEACDVPPAERVPLTLRAELITINPTTAVVRVRVSDPFPPGGASVTVNWITLPGAGVTPATGGTLTPTNDITSTNFIDYTIDRPAGTAPIKRVTFTATDTTNNRTPGTDAVDVPQQDLPSLELTSNEHSTTQWKVTWTATGTVNVSKNNAAFGTPAAAGLTSGTAFNRPAYGAADDVYAFRVVNGGVTLSETVIVPATKDLTGTSLTITTPFGVDATPGPQSLQFAWSASGFPSGTTFDVDWLLYTTAHVLTGASGYETNFTSGNTVTPSVAFVETDRCRVTIYAYHQGKVIFTKSRYVTCTF